MCVQWAHVSNSNRYSYARAHTHRHKHILHIHTVSMIKHQRCQKKWRSEETPKKWRVKNWLNEPLQSEKKKWRRRRWKYARRADDMKRIKNKTKIKYCKYFNVSACVCVWIVTGVYVSLYYTLLLFYNMNLISFFSFFGRVCVSCVCTRAHKMKLFPLRKLLNAFKMRKNELYFDFI